MRLCADQIASTVGGGATAICNVGMPRSTPANAARLPVAAEVIQRSCLPVGFQSDLPSNKLGRTTIADTRAAVTRCQDHNPIGSDVIDQLSNRSRLGSLSGALPDAGRCASEALRQPDVKKLRSSSTPRAFPAVRRRGRRDLDRERSLW